MIAHAYTEDPLVERPAIGLFAKLGWADGVGGGGTFGREKLFMHPKRMGWLTREPTEFRLYS